MILFPSPVGESYFSIILFTMTGRGTLVSVPCRGIFFSMLDYQERLARAELQFPSPVGESYFSICPIYHLEIGNRVSVPCRGILFFKLGRIKAVVE